MKESQFETYAENQADRACDLEAFSGLNLAHIRRKLTEMLAQIGANGLFEEYTRHDISHIDAMLKSLDFLIPKTSRDSLTVADWLFLVLSIYLHDLGLLVTRDEFKNRDRSNVNEFANKTLYSGEEGADYKARIQNISDDEQERFLYQEFVRHHHAERIREWLMGVSQTRNGFSKKVVAELDRLFGVLKESVRDTLGMICESHHLDDLNDRTK